MMTAKSSTPSSSGFVELSRMARHLIGIGGEDDAPGQGGRRAVELGIDEVGDAAEEEPDGADGAEQVEAGEDVAALWSG